MVKKMTFLSSNGSMTMEDDEGNSRLTPVLVLVVFIGILCVIMNCGVFILLIKENSLRRNPYHFLVLMLSVSDFLIGLANVLVGPQSLFPSLKRNQTLIVSHTVLMTNGLYLSLLQTFFISFQRFLVICKEHWNDIVFCGNRKYMVCMGGWIIVVITNIALVSPPSRDFNYAFDRFVVFVYQGQYVAFAIFNKALILVLLSSTIILYIITLRYFFTKYRSIAPARNAQVKHIQVRMAPMSSSKHPVSNACSNPSTFGPHLDPESSSSPSVVFVQLAESRHKKIVQTMFLVGLLIAVLLVFTGPLMVAVWMETSPRVFGIAFCICSINSLVNPILSVWNLAGVRRHVQVIYTKAKKNLLCK